LTALLFRADDILRRARWTTQSPRPFAALATLVTCICVFGLLYGGVMGTFGGVLGDRACQVLYSAVKVPLLLLATFLISLPSFFVLNTLFGLRRDLGQAIRALVATQAGVAIVLASLAPLTALWYASSDDYQAAILFNGLMFGIASLAAQWLLRGYYRPLVARSPKHRVLLWAWIVVYTFVGIQMGWMLRPFVGGPNTPVGFFRGDTWGNAYVIVGKLFWQVLTQ
jgi:hypothetical protein